MAINKWYILAKKDNRMKYSYRPIFNKSKVFPTISKARLIKIKLENKGYKNIQILKRTCEVIDIIT